MSLTEDWKDGKLCTGDYYYNDHHTKGVCRVIGNLVLFPGNEKSFFYSNLKEQGFEVLAPCDYEELQKLEKENKILKSKITGSTSDGYHTFDELYYHRMCLFACIVNNFPKSWKAKKHFDGSMYEGYFIVGIKTPNGQATYHYANEYWNLFKCRVLDNAPEWDGHTPNDVCKRIISLNIALDIELLSSRIHTLWANWFLHQRDFSTPENLERWDKQAHTRYEDLSDADKEKDRKIVKNLLFEAQNEM